MPTYEYLCPKCGRFEQFQRISDPPLERCPQCGARPQRLISPSAGILFKGSGFFLTDYHDARAAWGTGTKSEDGKEAGKPAEVGGPGKSASDAKGGSDGKAASDTKSTSDTKAASDAKGAASKKAAP